MDNNNKTVKTKNDKQTHKQNTYTNNKHNKQPIILINK